MFYVERYSMSTLQVYNNRKIPNRWWWWRDMKQLCCLIDRYGTVYTGNRKGVEGGGEERGGGKGGEGKRGGDSQLVCS